ncbi:MAG: hypothetical protein BAJALOKI1v1_470016 [Promethearchaeota archaeon]|nr:MAG: hypothetical protein BAJALOKI1v1_470016 [Candidatus Lokiarchaeota archaeon]
MEHFGERMKNYEKSISHTLPRNFPIIMRIDGRAFHTFTQDLRKPFDTRFIEMMNFVGIEICKEIPYVRVAYLQSDEINLLLYQEIGQESWFNNKIEKMTSISASLATAYAMMWKYEHDFKPHTIITFDCRVFIVPLFDVINYFIWRQSDWERNSLNMLAQKYYTQQEIQNKKKEELHELIFTAGDNWASLPTSLKNGRCIIRKEYTKHVENPYFSGEVIRSKWIVDKNTPSFSIERDYIQSKIPTYEIETD